MSNQTKTPTETNIFTYVKSFTAISPEELEASINAFISDPAFIVCGIQYIQALTGDFGAFLTYKVIKE